MNMMKMTNMMKMDEHDAQWKPHTVGCKNLKAFVAGVDDREERDERTRRRRVYVGCTVSVPCTLPLA